MSRFIIVADPAASKDCDMDHLLLVSEDVDMSKTKQIQIPKGLYVSGKNDEDRTMESLIRDSRESTRKKLEGKKIDTHLVSAMRNRVMAKKLAFFFNAHGFHADVDGQLLYRGKRYSTNLEENFIDLVDGLKRPPKGYRILYKLLKAAGLEDIPVHRMDYF